MQVVHAHGIDVVILMYNLKEYSDNYSKTSAFIWQYCRYEPTLDDDNAIIDFTVAKSITDSFKTIEKTTRETGDDGAKS